MFPDTNGLLGLAAVLAPTKTLSDMHLVCLARTLSKTRVDLNLSNSIEQIRQQTNNVEEVS